MLDGNDPPFWRTKTLEEMSREEWEALCDGCGRCCLVKLEDEDTAEIYLTRLSCGMLDTRTCRCKDYPNRFKKMPDCLEIDIARARELYVAAQDVCLSPRGRGTRTDVVAPAGFRLSRHGARGRHFRPQLRDERTSRQTRELLEVHHPRRGAARLRPPSPAKSAAVPQRPNPQNSAEFRRIRAMR